MGIQSEASSSAGLQLKCAVQGCEEAIERAEITLQADNKAMLCFWCKKGHQSRADMTINSIQPVPAAPSAEQSTTAIRTKVSGVTFTNADGTSRQELLKHIQPGDPITVVKDRIEDNVVYMVRHAIGIIGSVKSEVLKGFLAADGTDDSLIAGTVIQVTGGTEDKPTLGCNIELCGLAEAKPAATTPREEPPKTGKYVYMDPDGRNIFHTDKYCSGMRNAKAVPLSHARRVQARPCKRCAAAYITEQRGN